MSQSRASDEYLLGHSKSEEERLQRQSEELAADSSRFLDQIAIQPGYRVADIGCGPHGNLDLLSERVGSNGRVVGVEQSESSIGFARQFVAARGLRNVDLLHADATATGLPRGSFDVVHARLVLVNVPEPRRVVDEMVALVRPGGIVASHEVDWGASICEPPSSAWDRLRGAFETCSRNSGMDSRIGRKVPGMLRAAGLVDVQVTPLMHAYPLGYSLRNALCDLIEAVRDRVVSQGLLTEREYAEELERLRQHLGEASTLVIPNLFFQVWGRKPE